MCCSSSFSGRPSASNPSIGMQPSIAPRRLHANRIGLCLVFFHASYCGYCHRLENELRNQPGAVAALEANFVPVKINYEFYPNTAKQYGVTRLPTTVILAPNAQGDVLAVIPEYMAVDQYLSKLNKVVADAKRHDAGVFAQIQASPAVGSPAALAQPPVGGPAPHVNPVVPAQAAVAARPPVEPLRNPAPSAAMPAANTAGGAPAGTATAPAGAAATPMLAMTTAAGLSNSRPVVLQKPAEATKPRGIPPFGLDGFCPVSLVEGERWQPGKKAWGVIHRGRTYLFASPDEQRRFQADPDRYAPVSSGDDVVLLLEQGRSVSGCRTHGLKFDGHVYLFTSEGTLEKFRSNPRYYAERALQAMRSATQTAAVR